MRNCRNHRLEARLQTLTVGLPERNEAHRG